MKRRTSYTHFTLGYRIRIKRIEGIVLLLVNDKAAYHLSFNDKKKFLPFSSF